MLDEDRDWWQIASVALLILIAVGDLAVMGGSFAAQIGAGEKIAEGEAGREQILAALPSIAWPVICLVVGLAVVGIAAWRMYDERRVEGRWLWIFGTAALMVFWSCATVVLLGQAARHLARSLPVSQ
jgi:hypothetical protein